MSVIIVSTPNTSTAPAAPDAAAGVAASGDDFANVLQGQLALGAAETPVAAAAPLALPVASAASSADDSDTANARADGAFDATSLLATMAFVAPPVNVDAEKPVSESGEAATESALPTSAAPGALLRADKAATRSDETPLPAATTGDAAAKFAVTATTVDDAPVARKTMTESAPSEPTASTENVHAAAHVATAKHPGHNESTLSVTTPVRDPDWAGDFGQKIVWLASSETQSAQLTLNPPQMGPIEISLSVESGNASVSFASANAEVRDAIETALPRLREMLANAGIELGQTNVGAESFRQRQGAWGSSSGSRSIADNAILAADPGASLHTRAFAAQRGNGLVDLFA